MTDELFRDIDARIAELHRIRRKSRIGMGISVVAVLLSLTALGMSLTGSGCMR